VKEDGTELAVLETKVEEMRETLRMTTERNTSQQQQLDEEVCVMYSRGIPLADIAYVLG
jgi:phage shock protein A